MSSTTLKRTFSNGNFLVGKIDSYNGMTIKSKEYDFIKNEEAKDILQTSLTKWKEDKLNAIWFEISVEEIWWLPILLENGFVIHHAQAQYVMVTKWLLDTINTLPKYPFTYIGAGGLVVNESGDILLMRERRGPYLGWKFPGGLADPGEMIHETAIREVFEETGVETIFSNILAFRQNSPYNHDNTSNIYFVCVLRPKDETNLQLKPCARETQACKWMSRKEINDLPEEQFRWFARAILQRYDEWVQTGRRGCHFSELQRFPPNSVDKPLNQKKSVTNNSLNHSIGLYLFD